MLVAEASAVASIGAALQDRVADETRRQSVASKERRLEGQQAQQPVPQSRIASHAALAPRPDLRGDVVHPLYAERGDGAEHPQGEAGAIDGHDDPRAARGDVGDGFGQPAP